LKPSNPAAISISFPSIFEIARETGALDDSLRDPADPVIVAAARVHGLRLAISDQRIIASKLAPVVQ
jgi:PIN domain nuclease of toxin-antitoxin system